MALTDVDLLIQEFQDLATANGASTPQITHDRQLAPHRAPALPAGKCAVYVFSHSVIPCVLKVGKANVNCGARFQSQHYGVRRAPSTLAAKIVATQHAWAFLGFKPEDAAESGRWIRQNSDRDNFYLDANDAEVLGSLEEFLIRKLNPLFEGNQARIASRLAQLTG